MKQHSNNSTENRTQEPETRSWLQTVGEQIIYWQASLQATVNSAPKNKKHRRPYQRRIGNGMEALGGRDMPAGLLDAPVGDTSSEVEIQDNLQQENVALQRATTEQALSTLDAEIAERGADAFAISRSFKDTFEQWNETHWNTMQGSVSVSGGALHIGGNGFVQLKELPKRFPGETRTITAHIIINNNDRLIWSTDATAEKMYGRSENDIITGKYVTIGNKVTNGNILGGVFTITEVENDDGNTITVEDGSGKTYTAPLAPHEQGTQYSPGIYGWKSISVQDISIHVTSDETLRQRRIALQTELDQLNAEMTESETVVDAVDPSALEDAAGTVDATDVLDLEDVIADIAAALQQQVQAPDTSENRIAALEQRIAALQIDIDVLAKDQAEISSAMTLQEQRMESAHAMDESADEVLARFAQQEGNDSMKVTPSIRIDADRFKYDFRISFEDMPAGYSVQLDNQTIAIPEGSGSLRIGQLPRPGNNQDYNLELIAADGSSIKRLTVMKLYQGKIARVGARHVSIALPQLAYVPGLSEELRVSTEQKLQAQADKLECVTIIDDVTTQLAQLQEQYTELQHRIDALGRQQVPYSRMHAAPTSDQPDNDHSFGVHFASNREQTYFEVLLDSEPGVIYRRLIKHPSGQSDGYTEFDIRREHGGSGNGNVRIRMFADESKTELLEEFIGRYDRLDTSAHGETNGDWNSYETGRIIETPYTPTVSIVKISGPNILVAVQSPYDSSSLHLSGGGLLNEAVILHEGGAELSSRLLTFNADSPEGYYAVTLREGRNGNRIGEQSFHWNPTTKELSLHSENTTILADPSCEAMSEMHSLSMLFDKINGLENMDLNIVALIRKQGEDMLRESQFFMDDTDDIMYIQNSRIAGHPDAGGIFRQLVGVYQEITGTLLQSAAKIAVASWNGESQREAIESYERVYAELSGNRYLAEFAIDFGVRLPSMLDIRTEGLRLALEQVDRFIGNQAKQASMYARLDYLANHSGDDPESGEGGGGISQAAYEHNLAVIAQAHGINSPQYLTYVDLYGSGTTTVASAVFSDNAFFENGELIDGDARLDRWWATAGESVMKSNWEVEIVETSVYKLRVSGFDQWKFDERQVFIDGKLMDMTQPVTLNRGLHTFTFQNISVPSTPVVDEVNFQLIQIKEGGLEEKTVQDFDAMFIADHKEEFSEQTSFRITGSNRPKTLTGVSALVNEFAPILHFNEGEDYPMPVDAAAYFAASGIENDGNTNASFDMPDINAAGKVYASVLRNPSDPSKLAINYYFFYPRSNWGEKGGYNTHEGDWESATLFFEMDGDMNWVPKEIAMAQHVGLLDNFTDDNLTDGGDNVLWEHLEKQGNQAKLYIGFGGHATYAHSNKTDWIIGEEQHYGLGAQFNSKGNTEYLSRADNESTDNSWALYSGQWGVHDLDGYHIPLDGDDAPLGPMYETQWIDPWQWKSKFNFINPNNF